MSCWSMGMSRRDRAYENGQVVGDGGSYRLIVKQQDDLQWKIVTGIPMTFINSQICR